MNRRNFIVTGTLAGLAVLWARGVSALNVKKWLGEGGMPFTLAPLPYAYNALEPYIDAKTMEIHYTKHHQAYVDKLNQAVQDLPDKSKSIEELIGNLQALPEKVREKIRNNGGGHWNHTFFWQLLSPEKQTPSPALKQLVEKNFTSWETFEQQFKQAALSVFGSGWAWLIKKNDGTLAILTTPNQDNSLMDIAPVKGKPLLGIDVWEHAYYLHYQNKRADYVQAFFEIINWQQ